MIPATSPEEREVLAKLEGMGPLAQEIIRKCDTLRAAVLAIERESKLHEKFVKAFDGKTAEEVIADVKQVPDKVGQESEAKANTEEDPGLGAEPTVKQQVGPADEEKAEPGGRHLGYYRKGRASRLTRGYTGNRGDS